MKILVALGLMAQQVTAYAAEAGNEPHDRHVISLQVENDLWFGETDQDYTNGLRLTYVHHPGEFATDGISAMLKKLSSLGQSSSERMRLYYSFGLGQNMYTPKDIENPDLILNDRPYAGWTYLEFGVTAQDDDDFEVVKLDLGIVGPASGAGYVQRQWHKLIGSPDPRGWSHQLPNEPGVNLHYFRGHRFWLLSDEGRSPFGVDFTPHVGAALGNVYTYGALGGTLRLGNNLRRELGAPPRIQPSLPGSDYFAGDGFSFYLFAGGEVRAMARNIFLDGTWRTHEHHVSKKTLVMDLQVGAVILWDNIRFALTHAYRTDEYDLQEGVHEYGAVTMSFRF